MTTSQTWTTEQDDYLRQHYASTPTADLPSRVGGRLHYPGGRVEVVG